MPSCTLHQFASHICMLQDVRAAWNEDSGTIIEFVVLMLYDNMEQLVKLRVSIFALLTWTDCNSEFISKKT